MYTYLHCSCKILFLNLLCFVIVAFYPSNNFSSFFISYTFLLEHHSFGYLWCSSSFVKKHGISHLICRFICKHMIFQFSFFSLLGWFFLLPVYLQRAVTPSLLVDELALRFYKMLAEACLCARRRSITSSKGIGGWRASDLGPYYLREGWWVVVEVTSA